MKCGGLLVCLLLFGINAYSQEYKCIPAGIDLNSRTVGASGNSIKLADKLKALRARCSRGRLVDPKNRQIRVYQLQGCWGNPPADYRQVLEKQRKEVAVLRNKFTVIELACDQGVSPRSIP